MLKSPIPNKTTFRNFADHYYHIGKDVCIEIWSKPNKFWFEDVFHNTILKCMVTLDGRELEQDEMKSYWFKAFRLNMIRWYGYAFNKYRSGNDFELILLPTDDEQTIINRMDGFKMLEYVHNNFGEDYKDALWLNLQGTPIYKIKGYGGNLYHKLDHIKKTLKGIYYDGTDKMVDIQGTR